MSRRQWVLVLVATAALVWALWPRRPPTDEELIRAAVQEMASQAERKQLSDLMEHVSARYHGEGGSKDELKSYLGAYLFQAGEVVTVVRHLEVHVEGDAGKVSMVVLLMRGPVKRDEDVRPELVMGSHRIEAEFAREDRWRVVSATRKDVPASELLP